MAKDTNPAFIIIAQNGHELLTENGEISEESSIESAYLDSIDGVGREDIFYGYDDDNVATPIGGKAQHIVHPSGTTSFLHFWHSHTARPFFFHNLGVDGGQLDVHHSQFQVAPVCPCFSLMSTENMESN